MKDQWTADRGIWKQLFWEETIKNLRPWIDCWKKSFSFYLLDTTILFNIEIIIQSTFPVAPIKVSFVDKLLKSFLILPLLKCLKCAPKDLFKTRKNHMRARWLYFYQITFEIEWVAIFRLNGSRGVVTPLHSPLPVATGLKMTV